MGNIKLHVIYCKEKHGGFPGFCFGFVEFEVETIVQKAFAKYKWQKANSVGKKVTSGMDLANTLTNVVIIASITMELNMVYVRSTNHGITNITGQNMLVTATHLATTKTLPLYHGIALTMQPNN
ncbi:hypothetical protein KY285_030198 [Solanum tuberosum]|nr:hypothetical protein KY285_030198 [Solanum tuberosum]